jgi:hypothetical protein
MKRKTELLILIILIAATCAWRTSPPQSSRALQRSIEQSLRATTAWRPEELKVACPSGSVNQVELRMRLPQSPQTRGCWLENVQELVGFTIDAPVRLTVRSLDGNVTLIAGRTIYPRRAYEYSEVSFMWLKEAWPPCEREERQLQRGGVDFACIQKWYSDDQQLVTVLVKPPAARTAGQARRVSQCYDHLSALPSPVRFVLAVPGRFAWENGALTSQARAEFEAAFLEAR